MAVPSRITPENRGLNATECAARLASRRFQALARRDLLAAGFTENRVDRWLQRGRLHPQYPGVYSWGRSDLAEEGQLAAALLYAGKGSALGSITCLWWQRLLGRRPHRIHVDAPGRERSLADVQIRHPRALRREVHRGLPVVPLPDSLLPASSLLSHNALRLVLARAEYEDLLGMASLEASLGSGRPGSRAVRAALDSHLPQLARCANRFERLFVLLCEREDLPMPSPNERVGRWRPDMLWRDAMLVVELDGGRAHSTAAQLAGDAERQEALEALGFAVLRFTWDDVTRRPAWVAAQVQIYMDDHKQRGAG